MVGPSFHLYATPPVTDRGPGGISLCPRHGCVSAKWCWPTHKNVNIYCECSTHTIYDFSLFFNRTNHKGLTKCAPLKKKALKNCFACIYCSMNTWLTRDMYDVRTQVADDDDATAPRDQCAATQESTNKALIWWSIWWPMGYIRSI